MCTYVHESSSRVLSQRYTLWTDPCRGHYSVARVKLIRTDSQQLRSVTVFINALDIVCMYCRYLWFTSSLELGWRPYFILVMDVFVWGNSPKYISTIVLYSDRTNVMNVYDLFLHACTAVMLVTYITLICFTIYYYDCTKILWDSFICDVVVCSVQTVRDRLWQSQPAS